MELMISHVVNSLFLFYIRKPRVNQFVPYLNQITQWCQEGKTARWIHEQLIHQGFKGGASSTRLKVQEIKANLPVKTSEKATEKISKKSSKLLKATKFQLTSFIWRKPTSLTQPCLLYTSDAADE